MDRKSFLKAKSRGNRNNVEFRAKSRANPSGSPWEIKNCDITIIYVFKGNVKGK